MTRWAFVTGEYPPQRGGVADYTRIVATELAAHGDAVTVYAPQLNAPSETDSHEPGVVLHRLPGHFGRRGLVAFDRLLHASRRPDRLVVQYVPYGYGWKGMNVPFCWWVYRHARKGNRIDLVVHEAFVGFGQNPKYWIVAIAQRLMAWLLLHSARRVWCAIPFWEKVLRPFAPRSVEFRHLPVPSNVPEPTNTLGTGPRTHAVGCFSSFGSSISSSLAAVLEKLLPRITGTVLLIGLRSKAFRDQFVAAHPEAAARLIATGPVELAEVPAYLNSCEVMLQPVGGGITGRNAATLACIQHGCPVVSTRGHLTEPFWPHSGAVVLAPAGDAESVSGQVERLLGNAEARVALSKRARAFYDQHFDLRHTIAALAQADGDDSGLLGGKR